MINRSDIAKEDLINVGVINGLVYKYAVMTKGDWEGYLVLTDEFFQDISYHLNFEALESNMSFKSF